MLCVVFDEIQKIKKLQKTRDLKVLFCAKNYAFLCKKQLINTMKSVKMNRRKSLHKGWGTLL